jgi:hypothetical protein
MAGNLILFKNLVDTIEGTCEAAGYEKQLKLDMASFNVNAVITPGEDTGSVYQSGITVSVPFGPWIAQLQQALFHGKDLGDVTITEVAQALDADKKKTWKKVRELTLKGAWIESMGHSWTGISGGYEMTLQYTDITFGWGDKIAHYNRSEKTT